MNDDQLPFQSGPGPQGDVVSLDSFFQQAPAAPAAPPAEPFAMPSLSSEAPQAASRPVPPAVNQDSAGAPPAPQDVTAALQLMKNRLTATKAPTGQLAVPKPGQSAPKREAAAPATPEGPPKPPEIWEYRVGQAVFREGEMTYELFMFMEGAVDVFVGEEKVATLDASKGAGAYLGEIGALLRTPRTATVKAIKPCKFLVFPDVRRLFEEDPEFGFKLSSTLAKRLAQSNENHGLVMDALYKAKVKDEVVDAVKEAFNGKKSTYYGKKGWFG